MFRAIQDWFRWVWSEWDRFWFTPVNPSLLGIIRILAGGMIFYTHLVWTKGLQDFFGSEGWQSKALLSKVQENMLCPSFWWHVPDAWLFPVHYLCLAILAAFMLGLATRVTSVLTFAIVVSYAYRTMNANFGLDQVNGLLAMYLAVGPCGRCWSIDALIRKWRGGGELPKSVTANISLRLIQLHLCIIYSYAGIAKLGGTFWWNGYAGWLAAANYEYQSGSMLWMANYPYLYNFVTHVTIAWELSFWSLVWHPRLRPIVLAVGIGMHLGIGAFLGMWTFGLAMIFAYASFIPPEWFTRRIKAAPPTSDSSSADSTTDAWQSRLQSYIETYIASVTPETKAPTTRVNEPMVVTPRKPETVTTGTASSRLSKKNRRKVEADARIVSSEETIVAADEDAAETASLPRVLLIEPRMQRGLQLQEALLKEGYQCRVAVDPSQAAQSLAVRTCDTLIVNATSMNRKQWLEFVDLMGDHPGPDLNLILILQPWQWEWQADVSSSRVQAVRYPSGHQDVVEAVDRVS